MTLARRFRTQRTDRLRLGDDEVFSKIEFTVDGPTLIEIAFESSRSDCAEGLAVYVPDTALEVIAADLPVPEPDRDDASLLSLVLPPESIVQLGCMAPPQTPLSIWNTWMHGGTEHAWTGNSGMMVEWFEPPPGAAGRARLWCSDGLGDPSFDDLVATVTVGRE